MVAKRRFRMQGTLDGGLSWLVVFGSFMSQFVVMGIHFVFGLLYIDLLNEFGQSKATTAWVASIAFGFTFCLAPLGSLLCKKLGCKVVMAVGGIMIGIGIFLSSFVDTIFLMYVTYSLIFGLGSSMCYMASVLVLSEYFNKNLVVANGIALAGAGVGAISLAPALSFLLDNYNWRNAVRILSGASLVLLCCAFIYYLVPSPLQFVDAEDCQKEKKCFDFSLFKNKAYVLLIAANGLVLFGFYMPYVHLVRHGQDLGIHKQKGGVLVGFIAVSETVGKIIVGRIADHPRVNRVYLYQMCMLVCSVLTTLLPILTSYKSLLAYCILFGVHDGGFVVLIAVLVGDVVGKKKMASAYGIMYCIASIPMILGPPIAGWMYPILQSYVPAFYMSGAFTTLGVCLLFLIPILLPPEIAQEWRMRRKGYRVQIPSSTPSQATKSLTLDSGSFSSESEDRDSKVSESGKGVKCYEKKDITVSLVKDSVELEIVKEKADTSTVGCVLEKYFSMPKLVNQQDCVLGYFSDYSRDSEGVWIHSLDPNRETMV